MRDYVAILEQASDGGWGVYVPDLPGCTSWGKTRAEAALNVKDAIQTYLEVLSEHGDPVPEPKMFAEIVHL